MIGNGNVAIDVAPHAACSIPTSSRPPTPPTTRSARSPPPQVRGGDRARPPRPGAGRVHQPRAARAGRADPRRRRSSTRPTSSSTSTARAGWRPRATPTDSATSRSCASYAAARAARARRHRVDAALPALAGGDPRRGRGRPGDGRARRRSTGIDETAARVPTGEEEVIACGLVLRSIGYRGAAAAPTSRSTSAAA